ncbi:larval cuticle protein 65Ag1-like [Toxorhynchites rutilus septentrionalis]|uniref:larval cuticle protein 65Ag1-like n=1 Tax=Toxorhynchites rutilus septentrionalis TaxID=329112 RepID=UPI00247888F3|nr:larval cuticle protein 65Ag1-like [Toxorhynchites rutilus septentrionalis]
MKLFVVLFVTLFAVVFSAPQGPTPVPIVSENSAIQPDGSFQYSFETGDGIKAQNQGSFKKVHVSKADGSGTEEVQALVQTGSFSYPSPDGSHIELKYTADENGFQPEGAHLPVVTHA